MLTVGHKTMSGVQLLPIINRRERFSYAATATFSGFLPGAFEGFSVTTGSGFSIP